MLVEYIEEALKRAKYEIINDSEPYYGEVEELPGVWATGKTPKETEKNMCEAIKLHIDGLKEEHLPIPKSETTAQYIIMK